jgi:gliding motility-associated-like protein
MQKFQLKNLLVLFAILLVATKSFSQVTLTQATATELVQDVLVGGGVQVSNITSGGNPSQIGRFVGGNTVNLGITNGVIMTTGDIVTQSDQNGFGFIGSPAADGTSSTSGTNTLSNDPDLNTIISSFGAPATTNNIAVIEFDFIPAGDSVAFNYVFASEEYNGFVCSQFFDVFGFFISGPGITGPYANNSANIAVVPNTNPALPVSMNTINSGASNGGAFCPPGGLNNQAYFVDNSGSQNFSPFGFTTILTAQANVQCGETYHIKLIIANGSDQSYDSWVFLEAESFSSSVPDINIANLLPDSAFIEGCLNGEIVFERNLTEDTLIIPLIYSGSATFDVDFTGMPDTLVFLPGEGALSFELVPTNDGIAEGVNGYEDIIISFTIINECGQDVAVEQVLKIRDPYTIDSGIDDSTLACPDTSFSLISNPSGGYPPYTFTWNTGETTASIDSAILQTSEFSVTITDSLGCPNGPFTDNATITMEYDTLTSAFSEVEICSGDTISINTLTENGAAPFVYSWESGESTDTISVTETDTLIITYTVTDACNIIVTDSVAINVPVYLPVGIITIDTTVCANNSEAVLFGFPFGGNGVYTYEFDGPGTIDQVTDTTALVQPTSTTSYIITVTDGCGTSATDTLKVTVETCNLTTYNTFSPNGDGKNDYFYITNIEAYPGSTVYLYTRWGKKVFEQTDYKNNWTGSDVLTSGTYYYVVEPNNGSEPLKGYVTVFRE